MHHGWPTLNLSSLTSVALPNRVSSISSPRHSFSASISNSKPNSWSISLSCYPFRCNTLPHSYLLLLSNYCLILTVVTSTRIRANVADPCQGHPPHSLWWPRAYSLLLCHLYSELFAPLFMYARVYIRMDACMYIHMTILYLLDVFFYRLGRSSSTLSNSTMWLPY